MYFDYLKNFMDHMADKHTPGNAVEVYIKGEKVFSYTSGYSDLENKIPLTGNEKYYIYSCSKIATVTAGMQLLERGKFLMSDPLYEYIPEYRYMKISQKDGGIIEAKNPITIGNLFSMTAGFSYNFNTAAFKEAALLTGGKMNTVDVIKNLAKDPLSFEPGTHWQYSLCHDVLAGFIEIISGKKFRDYVKENIFDPLEMNDSCYHADEKILSQMAQQYSFVPNGESEEFDIVEAQKSGKSDKGAFVNVGKQNSHILGDEYDSGGAGIITTVSDYVKFMAALSGMGKGINGARILSSGSVELMRTNTLSEAQFKDYSWAHHAGYGYGFGVRTLIDKAKGGSLGNLGEFGWGGAAGATAMIDPSIGLSVFYAQHCLNPREEYYQPRLRNVIYSCIGR